MDILLLVAVFSLGAILSSFIAVLVERTGTGQSWVRGRSRCDSCTHVLDLRDLVPVASWLSTKGRCRYCGSRMPIQHVFVEAGFGTLAALSFQFLGLSISFVLFMAALCALLFVVLYDLRHTIVSTVGWVSLLVFSTLYALVTTPDVGMLGYTFLVAGCISLFFFALHFFSGGRAMGLGDAPVVLALSILLGSYAFSGFLFSFWIGAVVGILILVLRRGGPTMGIEVPFVPFLAAGYLLAFFTRWTPFLF